MDYYDLYDISPEDEAKLEAQAAEQEHDDWLARWSDDFHDDKAFTEIEIMLAAWRAGTPAARDVALQLADDNRRRSTTPDPANAKDARTCP